MALTEVQLGLARHHRPSLIGRERELEAVGALILHARERLVTLTGIGGCGKTSLAVEIAARLRSHFSDGVFLVDLSRVSDGALVAETTGEALGIRPEPSAEPLAPLLEDLQGRNALLLLDNCEHVIGACTALARAVLEGCPDVRILATSREPLRAPGERQYRVLPLAVPRADRQSVLDELASCASVQLFVERAEAFSPGFALNEANARLVGDICLRLEGIPLAIELAAGRVRVLALEQIRDRLDDCFRLLSGGGQTMPRRQQTLRRTLDWSYDILEDPERATLRRLGAFVGWLDLEAAEAVCAGPDIAAEEVLDLLARLVDKSLVVVERVGDRARYRLLEPVRQYARHRLATMGEVEATLLRHLEHYVELAERLEPVVWGGSGDQSAGMDRLEAVRENVSAAVSWGVVHSPDLAIRLAAGLWHFWQIRGLGREGRQWLEALLRGSVAPGSVRAKATVGAAFLARDAGDIAGAEALSYQAIAAANEAGDVWAKGMALLNLGILANLRGDGELARREFAECLSGFRAIGHQWGVGSSLYHLAYIARLDGDPLAARDLLEESLAVHHFIGDRRGASVVLGALGRVFWLLGDPARANAYTEESLRIGEMLGVRDSSGLGLAALLARSAGDYARARELTRQGIDLLRGSGVHQQIPEHLSICGTLLIDEGAHARGVRLIAAAHSLDTGSGQFDAVVARALGESSLATARSALGEAA